MIKSVEVNDKHAQRNAENILSFYDLMLNQRKPMEAVQKYLAPDYIQHNPMIPTGAEGLGGFFSHVQTTRRQLKAKVVNIIAVGDFVWAHMNFTNLYNDDPQDRGIAGVDIYRMAADGKVLEHWDVLQEVPDPKTSANTNGMF